MPTEPYPPPDIQPDDYPDLMIDPQLLALIDELVPSSDDQSIYKLDNPQSISTRSAHEGEQPSPREDNLTLQQNQRVHQPYFLNRYIFSDAQRAIIHQWSHEIPSSMMERLKENDPTMTHSYRQIKGAVENERRKKNRKEANGHWKKEELEFINHNMDKKPKELTTALKDALPGCSKNVDQVRDMKHQLSQKAREECCRTACRTTKQIERST